MASGTANAHGSVMPDVVRSVSLQFAENGDALAEGMAEQLHRQIPELGGMDEELLRRTRESCASNIAQSYRLMHSGRAAEELVVTPEARDYVREFVTRGITLPVLLRTYRLGHAWIWEAWADSLRAQVDDPHELARAIEYSSLWMFAYIDLASAALVEDFTVEQSRTMRTAEQIRAATVQAILAGEKIDVDVASKRLSYELRRHHVAVRAWTTGDETGNLERAARDVATIVGSDSPLIVHTSVGALDAWCGLGVEPEASAFEQIAAYVPPAGVRLAIGGGGEGVGGFSFARKEAHQAERVAKIAGAGFPSVTLYPRIELVSLLSADPDRALRFVHRQLGALAAADEPTARLRETVLAFLRCNGSSGRAAKELFVHQNTVTYRIHRAEELLDRPISERQDELLCALTLAVELGYGSDLPSQPS